MACSKAVTDFERVGDEASKIAQLTLQLFDGPGSEPGENLCRDVYSMGNMVREMWKQSFDVLERIGDHSKNIAEQIIYLMKGEDVRHRQARLASGGNTGDGAFG